MATRQRLKSAKRLASKNPLRFPNESEEYRRARNALLAEEIDLRRHIERVAEQRRALPHGGPVTGDYRFVGENGPASFGDLFGDKDTLAIYSYMFGPELERPCPMCTSLLSAWDGEARDIEQNIALAVVARSPIERLICDQARARLARAEALLGCRRPIQPRLQRDERRRRDPGAQRVHAPRRNQPPLLGRRDDVLYGRSRPGSAWRAGPDADLDRARYDAGWVSPRLVSEARVLIHSKRAETVA